MFLGDPVDIFRFCRCTSFLLNSCEVSHASKAVLQAMCTAKYQLLLKDLVSEAFRFPSRSTMMRARLIHREAFRHGRYRSPVHGLRTLYVYIDSSPTEGPDVMGTIVDVCISGSQPSMFLLPGVFLAHGYSSATDKAAALLWQL